MIYGATFQGPEPGWETATLTNIQPNSTSIPELDAAPSSSSKSRYISHRFVENNLIKRREQVSIVTGEPEIAFHFKLGGLEKFEVGQKLHFLLWRTAVRRQDSSIEMNLWLSGSLPFTMISFN